MAVDDGGEGMCQIGLWIDGIEFAGLNQLGDGRPVLGSRVVPCKERVFPVEGYGSDGALDAVVVDLDAPVGQEELQTIPVFGDISQVCMSATITAANSTASSGAGRINLPCRAIVRQAERLFARNP